MSWDTGAIGKYYREPYVIYSFGAPQAVSTETPLLALTELGRLYKDLTLTVRNHGAQQCAFYVDRSESGVSADADRQTVYVPAGLERRLEFRDVMSLFWGLSAAGDPDGGFPSVNVSWQIIGNKRG